MANKIFNHWITKNILGAVAFFAVLLIGVSIFLSVFTRHGKSVEVPDFTNMTVEEAQALAESAGLLTYVSDSVFVRGMEKGAVYMQDPKSGSRVKLGRTIDFTINAQQSKMVSMPNLIGFSMRQARSEMVSKGLELGRLNYVNDIATNNVLKQQIRGKDIEPGVQIEAGSRVDLVVGLNPEDDRTYVPDVIGMRYMRAVGAVQDNSLNVRRLVFDSTVKTYSDSLTAVVYRQNPQASRISTLIGSEVNLYLTLDESRLPKNE